MLYKIPKLKINMELPFDLVETILKRVPEKLRTVLALVCREWGTLTPPTKKLSARCPSTDQYIPFDVSPFQKIEMTSLS